MKTTVTKKECVEINELGAVVNDGAAAISKLDSIVEKVVRMDRSGRWALADLSNLSMKAKCGVDLNERVYVNDDAAARAMSVRLVKCGMRLTPSQISQYALVSAVFGADRSERYVESRFSVYLNAAAALYKKLGPGCTTCTKTVRMATLREVSEKMRTKRPRAVSKTSADKADEWMSKCRDVVAEYAAVVNAPDIKPARLLQFVNEAGGVVKLRNEAVRILGSRNNK